jgi:hypothetical protein
MNSPHKENTMTDPPTRRHPILASTSSKLAVGLLAVIVLASIPMVIAEARTSTSPSPPTAATTSPATPAMPPPASAPRAALPPGKTTQIAFQVTSVHSGRLITGRILRPLTPTTLTRTQRTVTVELTLGAATQMGGTAGIEPGALLQARVTAVNNGKLWANSIVVLTGYAHLQAGEGR